MSKRKKKDRHRQTAGEKIETERQNEREKDGKRNLLLDRQTDRQTGRSINLGETKKYCE
jgi:hypothetical protein